MSEFWSSPASQFTPRDWEQIRSLTREINPEMERAGWLWLARRWEAEGRAELAAKVYEKFAEGPDGQKPEGMSGMESALAAFSRESGDWRNLMMLIAGDSIIRVAGPAVRRLWMARRAARLTPRFRPELLSGVSREPAWEAALPHSGALSKPVPPRDFRNLFINSQMTASKGYTPSQDRMWERVFETQRPVEDVARTISGSYLTGKVHDVELAQKFVQFYRQLPYFRHPAVQAKAAQESLLFRLELLRDRSNLEPRDLLKILKWRETSATVAFFSRDLTEKNLEILIKFRGELEDVYPYHAYSLFLPPTRSLSRKPEIWVMDIPYYLQPEERARQFLLRTSDLVHEYEHYRHFRFLDFRKPEQKLRAEMRAWLEEYLFRMHHGDLGFFNEAGLASPRDFGIYLRRWVERLYR